MTAPLQSNLIVSFPGSLRLVNEVEAVENINAPFKAHPNANAVDVYELHLVQTVKRPTSEKEIA